MSRTSNAKKRQYETMCSSCDQIVGVIWTPFNKTVGHTTRFAPTPKTARHMDHRTRRWCPGSQLAIAQAQMIPVGAA